MTGPHIVLFDGVCNLCVGSVQFIIRHDPERVFRFASLQSEVGRALSRRYDIVAGKLETMVLIADDAAFTRSEAAIRIACEFGGIWSTVACPTGSIPSTAWGAVLEVAWG